MKVTLGIEIKAVKFVECSKKAVAASMRAVNVGAAASSIADEIAAPGLRTIITAGSTTAKLLSGSLAAGDIS